MTSSVEVQVMQRGKINKVLITKFLPHVLLFIPALSL